MRELTVGLMVDVMSDVMTPFHDWEDGGKLLLCFFEVPATFPASTHHCVGLEGVVSVLAWSPMKSKHHSFLLLLGVCDFSLPGWDSAYRPCRRRNAGEVCGGSGAALRLDD